MTIRPVCRQPAEEDHFFVCGPVFLIIIVLLFFVRDQNNPAKGQVASQGHSEQWARPHPSRPICRRTTRSSTVVCLKTEHSKRCPRSDTTIRTIIVLFIFCFPALAGTQLHLVHLNASSHRFSHPSKKQINQSRNESYIYGNGRGGFRLGSWEIQRAFIRQVTTRQVTHKLL